MCPNYPDRKFNLGADSLCWHLTALLLSYHKYLFQSMVITDLTTSEVQANLRASGPSYLPGTFTHQRISKFLPSFGAPQPQGIDSPVFLSGFE